MGGADSTDAASDQATLGDVFADPDVARAYRHRPPYPAETFAILRRLLVAPRTVLDAGAGTGAIARALVGSATRVDAVDPSAAMIAEGALLPGGDDPRIRWIHARVEDAVLQPPYGLVAAGASLHWMDADTVLPRFADALAPGARLAIVETEHSTTPWRADIVSVIARYSELEHHAELPELLASLETRGLFVREGETRTAPQPVVRSVLEYLEALHSTSTLARRRLRDRSAPFDREVREVFARLRLADVRYDVTGIVVWGRPLVK